MSVGIFKDVPRLELAYSRQIARVRTDSAQGYEGGCTISYHLDHSQEFCILLETSYRANLGGRGLCVQEELIHFPDIL